MTHRKTERTTPQHSCSSPRRLHKWQVGRCRPLLPPSPLPPPRALNTCPEIGSSVELALGRANANTEEERREKGRERGPLVPYANVADPPQSLRGRPIRKLSASRNFLSRGRRGQCPPSRTTESQRDRRQRTVDGVGRGARATPRRAGRARLCLRGC